MAETQRGTLAVVWALDSVLGPVTGSGSWTTQDSDYSNEADVAELRNPRGATVTKIFFNKKNMVSMNLVVTGSTIANAKTSNVLPSPGDIMTVTDTTDTQVAGTADPNKYLFVSGRKVSANSDFVKFSVTLERYTENNVALQVT